MTLKDLLEHQPISEAIKEFTAPINDASRSGDDALEKSLLKTWSSLLETAASTPHAQQGPLIEFIQTLREEPSPKNHAGKPCKILGNTFQWKTLPLLGALLREAWNGVPLDSEGGLKTSKWVNTNALVARLTSLSRPSDPLDFSIYGIWGLRAALEDRDPESQVPAQHTIEAAAVWMVYAARAMWERALCEYVYGGRIAREGTTMRGREWTGCSKERWGLWKERFAQIWELCEEGVMKELVERATQEMAKAERD